MNNNNPITDEELARLRQLHEKATPGNRFNASVPTRALGWQVRMFGGAYQVYGDDVECLWTEIATFRYIADARVAQAARNALPRLLDEIEALRQERDELRGAS